jgi:hypothetical protein
MIQGILHRLMTPLQPKRAIRQILHLLKRPDVHQTIDFQMLHHHRQLPHQAEPHFL